MSGWNGERFSAGQTHWESIVRIERERGLSIYPGIPILIYDEMDNSVIEKNKLLRVEEKEYE